MFEDNFEAQIDLMAQVDLLQREKDTLLANRSINTPQGIVVYRKQHEKLKQQLKSDLKKSNTFVKKLKTITSDGLQQCIKDTESVNLNLFVSEIVNAVVATTYKATDVSAMVKLCINMHHKYEEFCDPLLTGLRQALITPPAEDDPEAGKRKRIQIRIMVELYQAGLFTEDEYFIRLLRNLMGKGKSGPRVDLQGIGTLVKYGSEVVFGYIPKKVVDLAAKTGQPVESMPLKVLTSSKVATELRGMLADMYEKLTTDLLGAHKAYRTKESKLEKDKLIHGGLTEQKQQEFDAARKLFEKLLSIVTTLSECTGQDMPVLEVEKEEEGGRDGLTVWEGGKDASTEDPTGAAGSGGLFGDPETRAFYEELPDLLAAVPLTILGLSPEQATALREQWAAEAEQQTQITYGTAVAEVSLEGAEDIGAGAENLDTDLHTPAAGGDAEEGVVDESKSAKLLVLLDEKLPDCINKQRADEFATSFCYVSTKNARRRLVQSIVRVPRFRSELTVTYARIVASLSRIYSDIAPAVLDALKREFFGMLKTKNQQHIEGKMKTVRYLGELVKFRIAPPIVAFRMFRTMFGDFTNQNAQLMAVLLETCGRFLYLLPYTRDSMNDILNTLMRLKRAKNLDLNIQNILEAAYFAVKPPERVARAAKKPLSVVQQYTRYLIKERLEEPGVSVEDVIMSLRRLPWKDAEENVSLHVLKASLKVARSKYVSIPDLADCLSGVGSYYPNLVVQLVDRVLEEIQRAMETAYKREIQRALGIVRLLGELYNFTAVSSVVIFDLLYHLINDGHSEASVSAALVERAQQQIAALSAPPGPSGTPCAVTAANTSESTRVKFDPRLPCDADPPTDLFRAQVVCELLNTCGMYFVKGKPKEKLTRFLVYFQRYLLTKQFIPMHVEFTILDCFDALEEQAREAAKDGRKPVGRGTSRFATMEVAGPMFPRFETLETAQAAVDVYEEVPEEERLRLESEQEQEGGDEDDEEGGHRRGHAGRDTGSENGEESSDSDSDSDSSSGSSSEDEGDAETAAAQQAREEAERSEAQAARMMEKMRIAEEDEEFEKAFKNVVQESVYSVSTKSNDVNKMVIPAVLPKPKNAFRITADEDDYEAENCAPFGTDGAKGRGVMFKLLSRDTKGRFETRQLQVPEDNRMAVRLMQAGESMRAERQRLKERVLQIDQLTAEAEAAEERTAERLAASSARPAAVQDSSSTSTGERNSQRSVGPASGVASAGGSGSYRAQPQQQGNISGVSFGGYGRVSYASGTVSTGRTRQQVLVRGEEGNRKPDMLNLDEFLAQSDAASLRKLSSKKNGRL